MTGRLIAVVGPSGVGKDSVMEELVRARPHMSLVRRVITRPSDSGGEVFDGVSEVEFADMKDRGAFVLSWQAHGLSYGVPVSIRRDLDAGRDLLVNLSRRVLPLASERFDRFAVVLLDARPDILAARLAARGRESAADIEQRLKRGAMSLPAGIEALKVDNSGALSDTVHRIISELYPDSVTRCN